MLELSKDQTFKYLENACVACEFTNESERTLTVKQYAGPLMGCKKSQILWDLQEICRHFRSKFCRISIGNKQLILWELSGQSFDQLCTDLMDGFNQKRPQFGHIFLK